MINTTASTTAATENPVTLPSGEKLLVRPLVSDDAPELATGFGRLSARSRYQRFFTAMPSLSAAHLSYLTRIDHHDHEALVAVIPATGEIVGVARFIRSHDRPDSAEIAVTIADSWQGRGVGTQLLHRLADRARQEGIIRLTGAILSENRAMLALIRRIGRVSVELDGSTTMATIALHPR